jgi:hypothetical protein
VCFLFLFPLKLVIVSSSPAVANDFMISELISNRSGSAVSLHRQSPKT